MAKMLCPTRVRPRAGGLYADHARAAGDPDSGSVVGIF